MGELDPTEVAASASPSRAGATGAEAPAILLTGVGKRYDIVSCFAALTRTIAVDPNPLAPAQYAAQVRVAVPPIADPGYVPALAELCERYGVGAVIPLTDLDIEVLARARESHVPPTCRRWCPRRRWRGRRTTSTRRTCCWEPRPAVAADGAAGAGAGLLSGDGQAAARLGGALDPPGARRGGEGLLRALRRRGARGLCERSR